MRQYAGALITGATSGIGEAFARELPAKTRLLLSGRDGTRLAALGADLSAQGRSVETVTADLRREDDRARLIAAAQDFAPELLINNAGAGRLGAFLDGDPAAECDTVMVNVVAVVALTRALLPKMIERARQNGTRAGLIVVASGFAFAPVPLFATYAASKAFDLHFAEALAEELRAMPVDVLALCPGPTRTAFGERAGYELGNLPGAREPRDVARGALSAIGCETVHIPGWLGQAALGPIVLQRRLLAGATAMMMRVLAPRSR